MRQTLRQYRWASLFAVLTAAILFVGACSSDGSTTTADDDTGATGDGSGDDPGDDTTSDGGTSDDTGGGATDAGSDTGSDDTGADDATTSDDGPADTGDTDEPAAPAGPNLIDIVLDAWMTNPDPTFITRMPMERVGVFATDFGVGAALAEDEIPGISLIGHPDGYRASCDYVVQGAADDAGQPVDALDCVLWSNEDVFSGGEQFILDGSEVPEGLDVPAGQLAAVFPVVLADGQATMTLQGTPHSFDYVEFTSGGSFTVNLNDPVAVPQYAGVVSAADLAAALA